MGSVCYGVEAVWFHAQGIRKAPSGMSFSEESVEKALRSVKAFADLDDDVRSYIVTMICDVKPDTADSLKDTVGAFFESMPEPSILAACQSLVTALGVSPRPVIQKSTLSSSRGGGGPAGMSSGDSSLLSAMGGAGDVSPGAEPDDVDSAAPRRLAGAVKLGSMSRAGDEDLMAFMWRKDTSDRSSQFNQSVVLGCSLTDDHRAAKKAAKAVKKQEEIEKRRAALALEEASLVASGPVVTGGSSMSDVRTQVRPLVDTHATTTACANWTGCRCLAHGMPTGVVSRHDSPRLSF